MSSDRDLVVAMRRLDRDYRTDAEVDGETAEFASAVRIRGPQILKAGVEVAHHLRRR